MMSGMGRRGPKRKLRLLDSAPRDRDADGGGNDARRPAYGEPFAALRGRGRDVAHAHRAVVAARRQPLPAAQRREHAQAEFERAGCGRLAAFEFGRGSAFHGYTHRAEQAFDPFHKGLALEGIVKNLAGSARSMGLKLVR